MCIEKPTTSSRFVLQVLGIYSLCFLFRYFEYFFIRTDSTFIGEAIIHKLIGVIIMVVGARLFLRSFSFVGFKDKNAIKNTLWGLGFGAGIFTIAYFTEVAILLSQGSFKTLSLYVTTYSVDKNVGNQTGLIFFVICVIGNIVNVIMEEGVFRGLFQKILEKRYCFIVAALFSSTLFGLWHVIAPIRNFFDGTMSSSGMIANIIMLVVTSALVGFKFSLITKLTGSLYMAMGDHFVNNTIVNMLHVISNNGTDELMVVRVAIAQALSCIIVFIFYLKRRNTMNVLAK